MICDACGKELVIGDWPYCPHGRSLQTNVFVPYYDVGLGMQVNHLADRWRGMRQQNLVDRPLPTKGDLSARKDRIEQAKRDAR